MWVFCGGAPVPGWVRDSRRSGRGGKAVSVHLHRARYQLIAQLGRTTLPGAAPAKTSALGVNVRFCRDPRRWVRFFLIGATGSFSGRGGPHRPHPRGTAVCP
jgi:hypothetical protein